MENSLENVDTVVEEVMEEIIASVVSDSSQIESTVHSVLRDIMAMAFGHHNTQLETDTVKVECRDRRMVAIVDQLVDAMVHLVSETLSAAPHV
ncbi:unnamed protein product, partial [Macrosiphum euphorbiae]